jgi:pimeloyl-ACP methyl ester carboxylesterase
LASRGIALLVYDKRGVGESTGNWHDGTYQDLALDAVRGVERLAERADVDAQRIGLIGLSEGGWTAPLAASLSPKVSFMVIVSGPPMTPLEQEYYEVETELKADGVPNDQIAEVLALLRTRRESYRTQDWEQLQQAIEAARARPWFERWANPNLPDQSSTSYRWYRRVMDYDPLPVLKGLKIPVFAAYGEKDVLVPAERSVEIMRRIRDQHDKDFTILLLAGASHNLSTSATSWPEEYWEKLFGWLDRQLRPARN